MRQMGILIFIGMAIVALQASMVDEATAIISWLNLKFSPVTLEAERDSKLSELHNPVKGEFETSAQFEQRKKDASARIAAIQKEYTQKIADARAAHEANLAKLRQRLNQLLASSRETIRMSGTLGSYDADTQRFTISIPGKSFQVMVPLDKAPGVKQNFSSYDLQVTRQMNDKLEWDYLEAKLVGSGGSFASTDKAPALNQASITVALIPPDLSAAVSFGEPSGNKMLDAEETAQVIIAIKNTGKGIGNMVEAGFELLNAQGISFTRSIYFGEIKAGETMTKTLNLVAGMDTKDAQAELKISFKEQNGFPPNDLVLRFSTKALLAPDVYIADIGIEDNSGNNKIEPGEQVEIKARVHNRGQGLARNVSAEVILGKDVYLLGSSSGSFSLGDMPSGTYKDIVFTIVSARTAANLDLKIDLKESRAQFSKPAQPLNLAFNRVERTADQMVVTGQQSQSEIASAPALSIDIEQDIPTLGKPAKNRWGVIFGIENYRNVSPVRFARRDANTMRDYFEKVLGIPSANLYIKLDEAASLSELKLVFDAQGWLARNASSKDSEIYIFFSGHGAPSQDGKRAYLLPYDGNPNYTQSSAYPLDELISNLKSLKAKQISLFLDSCFSGANRDNEIILADARPVFINSPMPSAAPNLAVFSASGGAQISSAYADKQHGLFSYYLMKGFRGEADTNQDRKITQQELYEYVNQEVSAMARRMGREQEPQLQGGDPAKVMIQW